MRRSSLTSFLSILACYGLLTSCSGGGNPNEQAINFPSLNGLPTDAKQDVHYTFAVSIPDSYNLTLSGAPAWLAYDKNTSTISGTPDEPGDYKGIKITITKSDSSSQSFGPFSIHVVGDPLVKFMWHFQNLKQSSFSASAGCKDCDARIRKASGAGFTGDGVRIAISDSGTETAHEDLSHNILQSECRNYTLPSPYTGIPTPPENYKDHGTGVSGIIVAEGWNGLGGRGVAPNAKAAVFRFLDSDQSVVKLVDQANGNFDIFNQSWGASGSRYTSIDPTYFSQLKYGVEHLRNSRGAIYVRSAGNSFNAYHIPNTSIFLSRPTTISQENSLPQFIVVGAHNASDRKSTYSSIGSNLWISAPGGEYGDAAPAIITTDESGCARGYSQTNSVANSFERGGPVNKGCNYTSIFNGTSSAAPVVSGVAALMLEANPQLSWRDVKYILAKTARNIDSTLGPSSRPFDPDEYKYDLGWVTNSAGFKYSNYYGFGAVDAQAAVKMAKTYSQYFPVLKDLSNQDSTWKYDSGPLTVPIPDNSATGSSRTIIINENLSIEQVEVIVSLTHTWVADVGIELTSPSGTKSILVAANNSLVQQNMSGVLLSSNAFLREPSRGTWTIKIMDGFAGDTGIFTNWKINLFGHDPVNAAPPPAFGVTASAVFTSEVSSLYATSDELFIGITAAPAIVECQVPGDVYKPCTLTNGNWVISGYTSGGTFRIRGSADGTNWTEKTISIPSFSDINIITCGTNVPPGEYPLSQLSSFVSSNAVTCFSTGAVFTLPPGSNREIVVADNATLFARSSRGVSINIESNVGLELRGSNNRIIGIDFKVKHSQLDTLLILGNNTGALAFDNEVTNCHFLSATGFSVSWAAVSVTGGRTKVRNNVFDLKGGGDSAVRLYSSATLSRITANKITGALVNGIRLFIDCIAENNKIDIPQITFGGGAGILMSDSSTSLNNDISIAGRNGAGIIVDGTPVRIEANRITTSGDGENGISLVRAYDVSILNNQIRRAATATLPAFAIYNPIPTLHEPIVSGNIICHEGSVPWGNGYGGAYGMRDDGDTIPSITTQWAVPPQTQIGGSCVSPSTGTTMGAD